MKKMLWLATAKRETPSAMNIIQVMRIIRPDPKFVEQELVTLGQVCVLWLNEKQIVLTNEADRRKKDKEMLQKNKLTRLY